MNSVWELFPTKVYIVVSMNDRLLSGWKEYSDYFESDLIRL